MGQIAVVTGAGVGRATIRAFAEAGYDVGLIGRDVDRLEAAAAEVRATGRRACVAPANVSDAEAVDRAADKFEHGNAAADSGSGA